MSFVPEDWLREYERQQEQQRQLANQLVQCAIPVLRFLGVRTVTIEYDGYGDDGTAREAVYDPVPAAGLPEGLEELIGEACRCALPSGWEINSGSFGTWTIDVAAGTGTLDHTWREEEDEDEGTEIV